MKQHNDLFASYAIYDGRTVEAGYDPIKKYTGGHVSMFSNATMMMRLQDPFTVLVDLKTMTYIDADPQGSFIELDTLLQKCKALP